MWLSNEPGCVYQLYDRPGHGMSDFYVMRCFPIAQVKLCEMVQ